MASLSSSTPVDKIRPNEPIWSTSGAALPGEVPLAKFTCLMRNHNPIPPCGRGDVRECFAALGKFVLLFVGPLVLAAIVIPYLIRDLPREKSIPATVLLLWLAAIAAKQLLDADNFRSKLHQLENSIKTLYVRMTE